MTRMSVVIASHNARDSISKCLAALEKQVPGDDLEIIVADSSSDGTDAIVQQYHPDVTLLHFSTPRTVPAMRGVGIQASHGKFIAILDPYSIVHDGWLDALLNAFAETTYPVIGGPVALANVEDRKLTDWAIYINEYGLFLPPMPSGQMALLPGCNIAYRREALFDGDKPRFQDFWKTFVNDQAGSLWLASAAVVSLDKPVPFGEFLCSRYDHGRCFAGMRTTAKIERLLRCLTAPLLPFAFLWRWGTGYLRRGAYQSKFFLTLPHQLLLFGNWARGEFVGYLRGSGLSCEKLFY